MKDMFKAIGFVVLGIVGLITFVLILILSVLGAIGKVIWTLGQRTK